MRLTARMVAVAAAACASLVVAACERGTTTTVGPVITEREALAREAILRRSGRATGQLRLAVEPNQTVDLRGYVARYWPSEGEPDASPISIGNDDPATGTVVVGGAVIGGLEMDATWQEVKTCCDADGLRLEADGWMASFGLYVENVEDGFAPRVRDGSETGSDVGFLLDGCYMTRIRDDAVEDDDLLSGTIHDCLFDGVNRFVSARPTEGTGITNPDSVVTIDHVLIHMLPMPNEGSDDGVGAGSIFKWSSAAGVVEMRHSIVYVEERSHSVLDAERFPPGTYEGVTLVLGPRYEGPYPVPLPAGVTVTRDVTVWDEARSAWLRRHQGRFAVELPTP